MVRFAHLQQRFYPMRTLLSATEFTKQTSPESKDYSPDTVFLTWHEDPTTTMVIQWVDSNTTADLSVHYSVLSDPINQISPTISKPYSTTEAKVYRSVLTGLKPGTEYHFRIGSATRVYRFRTMPCTATNEFRFISGGDSGIGSSAKTNNRIAAAQNPYFILIAGDVAYDDGEKARRLYPVL